jgi:hypothetical protein
MKCSAWILLMVSTGMGAGLRPPGPSLQETTMCFNNQTPAFYSGVH